eukprot:CAMPEP_0172448956 /NCGR_PEP_ID=MMETSP1065-20121228/7822_1 /TAXON_ID=265537 /ORGANISM="Amphiprora paludosa, Strain CCMP125" /LENGTH=664 /DNA_ID=CAMNT_0013200551 /DNA_START=187 /DNA_END=2181 /DNA_ORIENTATION=+
MSGESTKVQQELSIQQAVTRAADDHKMKPLPEDYEPGEHDVLCGRGNACLRHKGNVQFRTIVRGFLPQYSKAVTKPDKSAILLAVIEAVREKTPDGGFIKKDPSSGRWYEVGDFLAREKTSQAFRDELHDRYTSSTFSKKQRRREKQRRLEQEIKKKNGVYMEDSDDRSDPNDDEDEEDDDGDHPHKKHREVNNSADVAVASLMSLGQQGQPPHRHETTVPSMEQPPHLSDPNTLSLMAQRQQLLMQQQQQHQQQQHQLHSESASAFAAVSPELQASQQYAARAAAIQRLRQQQEQRYLASSGLGPSSLAGLGAGVASSVMTPSSSLLGGAAGTGGPLESALAALPPHLRDHYSALLLERQQQQQLQQQQLYGATVGDPSMAAASQQQQRLLEGRHAALAQQMQIQQQRQAALRSLGLAATAGIAPVPAAGPWGVQQAPTDASVNGEASTALQQAHASSSSHVVEEGKNHSEKDGKKKKKRKRNKRNRFGRLPDVISVGNASSGVTADSSQVAPPPPAPPAAAPRAAKPVSAGAVVPSGPPRVVECGEGSTITSVGGGPPREEGDANGDNDGDHDDAEDTLSSSKREKQRVFRQEIQEWLTNSAIGCSPNMEDMEDYANEFVELGLHSVEMIKRHCTLADVDSFGWMKTFHKRAFVQNAGLAAK